MRRVLCAALAAGLWLLTPSALSAWNATGHQLVAAIAWDQMTPAARRQAIALLRSAPPDACLLERFSSDSRPLEVREREFFMIASTWPDIIRPDPEHPRPCDRFHRGGWHYINYFWSGVSGATGSDQPTDRTDLAVPTDNAVERLKFLRAFVACSTAACGAPKEEQALALAWILHIVGDIQQPLHASARVTAEHDEESGDQGGNLFLLGMDANNRPQRLHSLWDGIISSAVPRQVNESDEAFLTREAAAIVAKYPPAQMSGRVKSGDIVAWSREGYDLTKAEVYPAALIRGQAPPATYRARTLAVGEERIALGGYRLADLLNRMFGG